MPVSPRLKTHLHVSKRLQHEPAARCRSHPARSRAEPHRAARDARDGVAYYQPSRPADDGAPRRCARAADAHVPGAARLVCVCRVWHWHVGDGNGGRESRSRRHPRARRRQRLFRRSIGTDVPALRRGGDTPGRRMGKGVRSRRASPRARRETGRRRDDGARRNVHRRPESSRADGADRPRARRHRDCGRRHLVWRPPRGCGRLGHRRVLQLHAEMSRGSSRSCPARLRSAGARAPREMPELLLRPAAAAGLLVEPQVSPHDVVDARLRARRSAGDCGRRGSRGALGAARAQPPRPPRWAPNAWPVGAAA